MHQVVSKKFLNVKLVEFLHVLLKKDYSKKFLKKAIESGVCLVNGKIEHFASYKMFLNDEVNI